MIAVTDEEEICNLHSRIGQVSDPDSNIIKELTEQVLCTKCVCIENGKSKSAEINNNEESNTNQEKDGFKFIRKLFGLVMIVIVNN